MKIRKSATDGVYAARAGFAPQKARVGFAPKGPGWLRPKRPGWVSPLKARAGCINAIGSSFSYFHYFSWFLMKHLAFFG